MSKIKFTFYLLGSLLGVLAGFFLIGIAARLIVWAVTLGYGLW